VAVDLRRKFGGWRKITRTGAFALVLLVLAAAAPAPTVFADTPQRTTLVLYPYHGVGRLDDEVVETLSKELELYLGDKVRTLYAFFARDPSAAYLSALRIQKSEPKPTTVDEFAADWQRLHALLLLDGIFVPSNGSAIAKSSIYFGELGTQAPGSPVPLVHLDLPLSPDEFGEIVDTHSAAALYGLALDARRNGLPKEFYVRVAARALEVVDTLSSGPTPPADLARLKCGLLNLISEATGVPVAGGC
jgi:hypothetical protein